MIVDLLVSTVNFVDVYKDITVIKVSSLVNENVVLVLARIQQ